MPLSAPYDDVFDAIKAHVDANWDSGLAPIYFENDLEGAPPGDVAMWVEVVLDTNLYGQESIGGGDGPKDNRWDEDGTLWFHVMAPRGIGSRESRRFAKALANLFRGTRLLDDELVFGDADMGAGNPGDKNANYYLLSVSIGWLRTDAQ